jgi:hypothetical protein
MVVFLEESEDVFFGLANQRWVWIELGNSLYCLNDDCVIYMHF